MWYKYREISKFVYSLGDLMKKLMTVASVRLVMGFCFIVATFVFGNIRVVKAEENLSVEGVWEVISVSSDTETDLIGSKISISRKGDGYEVKSVPDDNRPRIYSGNERHIVHTELEYLKNPTDVHENPNGMPPSAAAQIPRQQVPINYSYTLSADGNFLTREQDSKNFSWEFNPSTGASRNVRYEIMPGFYKRTLKRVAKLVQVESRGERAYQADCGKVDPNRTTPFPPEQDFCPGNLVAMTFFCGGGTGCPYVCCPKGLPYLNHCDCKCYATSDFDCHSFSRCQEQPKQ
jgi:hypothetical protein